MTLGGRVSTGLMQATPGEMKSFRSSALRMALIVARVWLVQLWSGQRGVLYIEEMDRVHGRKCISAEKSWLWQRNVWP